VNESNDLRLLFAEYVNGEISAERLQALEAALREDVDLRREFIEYMNVDSALGDLAALSEAEVDALSLSEVASSTSPSHTMRRSNAVAAGNDRLRSPEADSPQRRVKLTSRAVAFVAVVAATLSISLGIWMSQSGEEDDQTVASRERPIAWLVTGIDALLKKEAKRWEGNTLPSGAYQLERGLLHLRFRGNVMVYVEAPADFETASDNRVVLHRGRLSANVPSEGVGFTVETPEAEVIDFGTGRQGRQPNASYRSFAAGPLPLVANFANNLTMLSGSNTEFSVDVEAGASEVHVFEGLVRVQPRSRKNGRSREAVDLRTSDAVKIEAATEKPVDIKLASDRFIRSFDEPKRKYHRWVKELSPVAYFRMPIRSKGLVSDPRGYTGVVLTGAGNRPPHACGVFAGGSLRILADSTGRGGRVDPPPVFRTGQFTLAVFVYLESPAPGGTVATNISGDEGNFALSLDQNGSVQATVRNDVGELQNLSSDALLPLQAWRQLVMTVDGERLHLYEDGRQVASAPCSPVADSEADVLWFGTDSDGLKLWDGRIDEVALFDWALSDGDVRDLYQAALEEIRQPE
jgi:hypothetical protein